jgi:hypothetical protein
MRAAVQRRAATMCAMTVPEPPAIAPDDKNWTWVLERACPECGFDPARHPRERIGAEIRALAPVYDELLRRDRVRERPAPQVWSALEYGCHVRDVFELFLYRLNLMLEQEAPLFANWDQDETAVAERYDRQDPDEVRVRLVGAAGELADRYDGVSGEQWTRTGFRSDGSAFTVESFGIYLLHDPIHHAWDIEQGYRSLGSEG